MPETRIRPAGPEDVGALAEIGAATFVETFGHLYKPEDLEAFLVEDHSEAACARLLADPAYATWLVETPAGQVVGYAVAGPCKLPVEDMGPVAGELKRLYILKDHQGGGVGSRLLAQTLEWMEERGHHPLYISVWSENDGAQRLYGRHGFRKIKEYAFMVGAQADREFILERRD